MDDVTFNRKKAEQAKELARLVGDVEQWTKAHVVHSDDANNVYRNLELLRAVVTDDPVESQAALAGFKACWHMLIGDANEHCIKRNVKGFRLSHTKATVEEIEEALRALHIDEPHLKITKLRSKVGSNFKYNGSAEARAKAISRKTKYNPIKK